MGLSLSDLDRVTIGFLLELMDTTGGEVDDEVVEATPEILEHF